MNAIDIKPMSVNEAWQGRRFKTTEYKQYERDVLLMLPATVKIPEGPIELSLSFDFSNGQSDIDNGVKPFVDILQKKYGFNDRDIYNLHVYKRVVKKGQEQIRFKITEARI